MKDTTETKMATMIVWDSEVEKERVERWIEKLREAGHVSYHNTKEYDPEYSHPTLYFP